VVVVALAVVAACGHTVVAVYGLEVAACVYRVVAFVAA